jgi:hypothetical protein
MCTVPSLSAMSTGLLYVTCERSMFFSARAKGFFSFGPGTSAMLLGALHVLPSSVERRSRMRMSDQSPPPLRASPHDEEVGLFEEWFRRAQRQDGEAQKRQEAGDHAANNAHAAHALTGHSD